MVSDMIQPRLIRSPERFGCDDFWNGIAAIIAEYVLQPDRTGRWARQPKPEAGVRESVWLSQNRTRIADAAAPWVAILGERIVTRAESLDEVVRELKASNVRDALVAFVRPQDQPRPHRIA